MKKTIWPVLTLCFFASLNAFALEEIVGKVTYLEPTYLPVSVRFNMDGGSVSCPARRAITYSKSNEENNMAVYSTLLAAFMGEKTVRIYIEDGDTDCVGKYVHLIKD
jgi:hypothetical protein